VLADDIQWIRTEEQETQVPVSSKVQKRSRLGVKWAILTTRHQRHKKAPDNMVIGQQVCNDLVAAVQQF